MAPFRALTAIDSSLAQDEKYDSDGSRFVVNLLWGQAVHLLQILKSEFWLLASLPNDFV